MVRKKDVFTLLVAISDVADRCYLERLLRKQSVVSLHVEVTTDFYRLSEICKEVLPDLMLVSPIVLSDPLIPAFRKLIGLDFFPIISYCRTLEESQMCKHYDGKILCTDNETDALNVLSSVLDINNESDEVMVLTPREQEVVIAVVKGLTNKEIAEQFFLSTHTIITHRRNIARKLNIHSASGLTIYAIMNNLVTVDDIKI